MSGELKTIRHATAPGLFASPWERKDLLSVSAYLSRIVIERALIIKDAHENLNSYFN